jgi:two-component sensor histidine kinase
VVDVDTAIPLGLITNELLTNAYRYAFPTGSKGFIRVELRLHAGIVELVIGDTGIGLAEGKGASSSTGLRLVEGLAQQIGGTLTTRSGSGLRATVRFPLKKRAMSSA